MKFEKYTEITDIFGDGVIILRTSNRQPAYLAEIKGLHPKYELDRKFIDKEDFEITGNCMEYEMEENKLYNWKESRVQHFGFVKNGKLIEISKGDAIAIASGASMVNEEETEAEEETKEENKEVTFTEPVYYVNNTNANENGIDLYWTNEAITSLVALGELDRPKYGLEDYDSYRIMKLLNADEDLRRWAMENYTLWEIKDDFKDEIKKVYKNTRPGQVKIDHETFKKYCLPIILSVGMKELV